MIGKEQKRGVVFIAIQMVRLLPFLSLLVWPLAVEVVAF
jgi:hypothetical protein